MRTHWSLIIAVAAIVATALLMPAPTTAQGGRATQMDLKGPAPRLPNGKPSMAGVWGQTRRADVTNANIPGFIRELPYTEWGKRQWETYDPVKNGDYAGSCLPFGISRSIFGPHPMQIIQDNDHLVMLFEQNTWFHLVPTDGRSFSNDLPPSWFGESVGRWDGDTLIIETVNMNGYAKVDTIGHPLSREAKITQTFKRVNYGTIEHTYTVNDPKTYTQPWTIHNTWPLEPQTILMEYSCEEGNDALYDGSIVRWKPPVEED